MSDELDVKSVKTFTGASESERTTDIGDSAIPVRLNAAEANLNKIEEKFKKLNRKIKDLKEISDKLKTSNRTLKTSQNALEKMQNKEFNIVTAVALVVAIFTAIAFCTLAVEYIWGSNDKYILLRSDIGTLSTRLYDLENKVRK